MKTLAHEACIELQAEAILNTRKYFKAYKDS